MPCRFIRRHTEVIHPKHHHARRAFRLVQRRLSRQRKIRHPFVQTRAYIRPPQKLPGLLRFQRGNTSLRFQHFPRSAINLPANVKCQLRLYAHRPSAIRLLHFRNTPKIAIYQWPAAQHTAIETVESCGTGFNLFFARSFRAACTTRLRRVSRYSHTTP